MKYIEYNPKEITEPQKDKLILDTITNSVILPGDIVKLKGNLDGPSMVVTEIRVNTLILHQNKLERIQIYVDTIYFDKERKEFMTFSIPAICLDKISLATSLLA